MSDRVIGVRQGGLLTASYICCPLFPSMPPRSLEISLVPKLYVFHCDISVRYVLTSRIFSALLAAAFSVSCLHACEIGEDVLARKLNLREFALYWLFAHVGGAPSGS